MATKEEIFTIELNNANMGQEEFYHHVRDTFLKIYETIQTTRNDLDYANMMPEGLKDIKERFRNDDPDIGQDFTIGYVRNDGKDSYYIVADNRAEALEYARSIGYDVKNKDNIEIEVLHNEWVKQNMPLSNPVQINIKLDYKTKEEWLKTLKFAFEIYDYCKRINRIRL
jgi:hypothetical protein